MSLFVTPECLEDLHTAGTHPRRDDVCLQRKKKRKEKSSSHSHVLYFWLYGRRWHLISYAKVISKGLIQFALQAVSNHAFPGYIIWTSLFDELLLANGGGGATLTQLLLKMSVELPVGFHNRMHTLLKKKKKHRRDGICGLVLFSFSKVESWIFHVWK